MDSETSFRIALAVVMALTMTVTVYHRVKAAASGEAKLEEYCWPDTLRTVVPFQYTQKPLLRGQET